MNTFEKVQEMIAKQLKIDASKIAIDSDIIADLKADSLDMFYLVMALEEQFSISLSDDDALKLKKVSDVVKFVDSLSK